jgi:hypothetical protein
MNDPGPTIPPPSAPTQRPGIAQLPRLIRWARREWRENPLVRMGWKPMHIWAWIIFVVYMTSALSTLLMQVIETLGLENLHFLQIFALILMSLSHIGGGILVMVAILFIIIAVGPRIYERTFAGDVSLQFAPFTWEERMAGLVVPLLRAMWLATIPLLVSLLLGALGTIFTIIVDWDSEDVLKSGGQFLAPMLSILPSAIYYLLMNALVAVMYIRRVIQHPVCGNRPQSGLLYIANPFIASFVIMLAPLSCCCIAMPMLEIVSLSDIFSGSDLLQGVLLLTFGIGTALLGPILMYVYLMHQLRKDIDEAHHRLFQPEA